MRINSLCLSLLLCLPVVAVWGQEVARTSVGAASPRTEFISYDVRKAAEAGQPEGSSFYTALLGKFKQERISDAQVVYTATVNFPLSKLERENFLHLRGAWSSALVRVNGNPVGYSEDSKTPVEFNLSKHLKDGDNTIEIDVFAQSGGALLESIHTPATTPATLVDAYLYSQPRFRIEDFRVRGAAEPGKSAYLQLDIALANSFNYEEEIAVGYDIYDPAGKLLFYDKRPVKLPGNGRDTLRLNQEILGVGANIWTPATPKLYKVMLLVWREGRIIEYIPLQIGFTREDFHARLAILKKATDEKKVASYNAVCTPNGMVPVLPPTVKGKPAPKVAVAPDLAKAQADLAALKKQGITVLRPDYPQPVWFYNLCEQMGFWVVDQANLNCGRDHLNLKVGGTSSNDPRYLPAYLERVEAMFARTRNHHCILAWSLGGASGNGYNMYKCYQWLKAADLSRPVVYGDAQGEWNSDL